MTIKQSQDVIEPKWAPRHAKLIYKIGREAYLILAQIARERGKPPVRLMAHLVNQRLAELSPQG